MKKKISPTRQELLRLKKQLKTARSGHRLLKNKLDSLVQEFLTHIKELQKSRKEIDEKMRGFLLDYIKAENNLGKRETEILISRIPKIEIDSSQKNIMGVQVKEYRPVGKEDAQKEKLGNLSVDYNLKKARDKSADILENIIEYATLEEKIRKLAQEIESTRRRVNSLEHIYIPGLEENQKYIVQKLEESGRFERTVLMKLKEFLS